MKILVFAASLRKDSLNKKLAAQVSEYLRTQPNLAVDLADYKDFEMPIYDGDLESISGLPSGAKEFIRRIQQAQAIIISTPEYNGGIPGTLKNAIDWSSREKINPWVAKPLLLVGASPGALGAVRGLWHTRVPFEALGAMVYSEMFGLATAHQAFDAQGKWVDAKNQSRLEVLLKNYLQFAGNNTRA